MSKKNRKSMKRKQFIRFLKDEEIYAAFKRNFDLSYLRKWFPSLAARTRVCNINNYLNSIPPAEYITDAFHWVETHEGYDFWDERNIKWRKLCTDF